MKQLLIFFLIVFSLFSCNPECEYAVDLKNVNANVKISRLEKELFNISKPEDIQKFIRMHPRVVSEYIGFAGKDTQTLVQDLFHFYTNKELKEFYRNGEKINSGFPDLEASIQNFYNHVKYYYPAYQIPEVNTMVTGFFNTDYFLDEKTAVISMDYFYGKKSAHRPDEFQYMLERREPEFIVPGLALRVALEHFVQRSEDDERLLADMITWGKIHYFMERMMPCAPDSTIIMYSSDQLEEVQKNADLIWAHFIENKLFYELKPDIKRRYVEESPKVSAIGEKCPGRIGRYLGWQIVKTYMEKFPEVTLQQLMEEKDAVKIFTLSKYKPKVK